MPMTDRLDAIRQLPDPQPLYDGNGDFRWMAYPAVQVDAVIDALRHQRDEALKDRAVRRGRRGTRQRFERLEAEFDALRHRAETAEQERDRLANERLGLLRTILEREAERNAANGHIQDLRQKAMDLADTVKRADDARFTVEEQLAVCRRELVELNASAQELAAEFCAAINEPMYAGTRADWQGRAWTAEARVEQLEGALEDILTADETSTLMGAVAIAKHALQNEQ